MRIEDILKSIDTHRLAYEKLGEKVPPYRMILEEARLWLIYMEKLSFPAGGKNDFCIRSGDEFDGVEILLVHTMESLCTKNNENDRCRRNHVYK